VLFFWEKTMNRKKHPLIRLWNYARGHRRRIVFASLGSILNKIFDLAPPALIGAAVDIVVQKEDSLTKHLSPCGFKTLSGMLVIFPSQVCCECFMERI